MLLCVCALISYFLLITFQSSLYVGLIERIKSSVEAAVQMLSSKKSFLKEDRRAAASHTIGLAQSGALCIDLLARRVCGDKDSSW